MTNTTLATLEARLAEAEDALHALQIGDKEVTVVDQNGERVEYQRISVGKLQSYINELNRQIAVCKGQPSSAGPLWAVGGF